MREEEKVQLSCEEKQEDWISGSPENGEVTEYVQGMIRVVLRTRRICGKRIEKVLC